MTAHGDGRTETIVLVDEHLHGPLAEVIFLLRSYEERLRQYEQFLEQKERDNQVLATFNRQYHEENNRLKRLLAG